MADTTANPKTTRCGSCAKTEKDAGIKMKRCAKCQTTYYCSRECQKTDWKTHKKACAINEPSTSSSTSSGGDAPLKGLSAKIDKPFHRLYAKTWLHDRPEGDVYKLLIDTYRFRMEDDYMLEGDADMDSIYGGAPDGVQGFQRFLRLVQGKSGLLPSWWSQEKAARCVAVGTRGGGWSSLARAIEKSDVTEHYGNALMPMQLRMFGEQVYGRGPGGQNGASMLQMQMMAENGEGDMYISHIDLGRRF